MGLFSKATSVAMPDLLALSITQLCRAREEIERELDRRARPTLEALQPKGCALPMQTKTITVLSCDGAHVKLVLYRDNEERAVAFVERLGEHVRFPTYGGGGVFSASDRHTLAERIVPLALHEAGRSAVEAWQAQRDLERDLEYEADERERYEKLKAKFG